MLWVQGIYYLITGVWPLVHLRSFLAVTGPKTDIWLLQTVSMLINAIGATLLLAAVRRRPTEEMRLLGIASAFGLAAIDVIHVARRRIRPVYLLDALAEVMLISAWLTAREVDQSAASSADRERGTARWV